MSADSAYRRTPFRPGVFLSYPKPCHVAQERFIERVCADLDERGLAPRTLGVTDYSVEAPLTAIRQIMNDSNGLITIAFRRVYLADATGNHGADVPNRSPYDLSGSWLTSPWSHIEPAMAYQIGLPILMLRERGVVADGVLEQGVVGLYMPEFDVETPLDEYFGSHHWKSVLSQWERQVKTVVERRGRPPRLY
ncbi:hypothetical protein SUDANB95_07549 [Actinosynnema sp. ALI-1.44]